MFCDFRAVHLIALIIIIGAFILKGYGVDGVVDKLLIGVSAFFFGLHLPSPESKKNG